MKHLVIILCLMFSCSVPATIWHTDRQLAADAPEWVNLGPATGRFIYVDASASASGTEADGSVEKPYPTIKTALAKADPHDEIIIAPGLYQENLRISKPHITLRAKELHQAKVVSPLNDKSVYFALRIDAGAHYARVIGLDISGGYYYTVSLESNWAQDKPDQKGVSYVLLSQNRLHGSGRDTIKLKPWVQHVVIERNEIFNSGQRDSKNAEGIDNVNAHFMTVQDNYIHSIATTGLYAKGGARNTVIQRNYIRNTGSAGVLVGFDTSPAFFDLSTNPEMYEAINTRVDNNIIDGTQNSGIGVYAAKNTLIRHNTVLNSAQRYHAALFFGNALQDRRPEGKRPPSVGVEVYANIFYVNSTNPLVSIRYINDATLGPLSALQGMPVMANNVYGTTGSRIGFADGRPDSLLLQSADLAKWQRHIGSDQGAQAGELSVTDDYRILLNKNLLAGTTPLVSHDYFLKTRSHSSWAGAVEQ